MIVLYPFVVVVGLLCEAAVLVLGSMLHTTLGLNLGITVAILAVATLITFAGTMLSATGMHQKQLNILLRDMDPERFISVYEPLLKKAGKRPNVQLTMLAYLSTAYANLGQYEKALELLDEAPSVKEQVRADGLLLGNRCLIYIQMNQLDKAADCLTRLEAMVKADKNNALGGDVVQSARCLRIRLNASKGWATDVAWVKAVAASGQPPFYAASNQLMLGQVLLADHNKAGAKAALEKAAAARHARAELREKIKNGDVTLEEVLDSDDPIASRLKVSALIESLPGYGKAKAAKVMNELGISATRRVKGLGARQREQLIEALSK